jgi:excisionase family DNA binding protein
VIVSQGSSVGSPGRLLSASAAAAELGVSVATLRRYVAEGELEAVRLGPGPLARIRVSREALDRFARPVEPPEPDWELELAPDREAIGLALAWVSGDDELAVEILGRYGVSGAALDLIVAVLALVPAVDESADALWRAALAKAAA